MDEHLLLAALLPPLGLGGGVFQVMALEPPLKELVLLVPGGLSASVIVRVRPLVSRLTEPPPPFVPILESN